MPERKSRAGLSQTFDPPINMDELSDENAVRKFARKNSSFRLKMISRSVTAPRRWTQGTLFLSRSELFLWRFSTGSILIQRIFAQRLSRCARFMRGPNRLCVTILPRGGMDDAARDQAGAG